MDTRLIPGPMARPLGDEAAVLGLVVVVHEEAEEGHRHGGRDEAEDAEAPAEADGGEDGL